MKAVISSTGLWTPSNTISNDELVIAFNAYVDQWNSENASAIESGEKQALEYSNSDFIEKASGIKSRFVISKDSILDPNVMSPILQKRENNQISLLAEIATKAAQQALNNAGKNSDDVDAVIVACSNLQRAYPAIAIEVQQALGASGFAFDMNVACSSATFGIETARGLILSGQAKSVLVCNPEICSAHLNFKDRDSHFIFGDVATATLVEASDIAPRKHWEILGSKLVTEFSNNIRNNFGFLNRLEEDQVDESLEAKGLTDKLFVQNGRSVFKEVVPMVAQLISDEIKQNELEPSQIKRLWLHQANLSMNILISKKVMGKDVDQSQAPVVLDEYANTSSAGSIIAFHKHSEDFEQGDIGLICSFGAGYSAGVIFLKRST